MKKNLVLILSCLLIRGQSFTSCLTGCISTVFYGHIEIHVGIDLTCNKYLIQLQVNATLAN